MFKIITISCLMVTVAIILKKVDGHTYKPALIQKESVINSPIIKSFEHVQVGFENILTGYLTSLQDVEAKCSKVYVDLENSVQQLISIFKSCLKITNETSVIESDIQKLTDVTNDLKKHITEDVHEIFSTCFKFPYTNITYCINTIEEKLTKINLNDMVDLGLSAMLQVNPVPKLIPFLPNVKLCYQDLTHQFTPQYLNGIYHDLTNCTQSIQHLLGA